MANMINNTIKKEQMLSNLSNIYKRMGCSDDFEKEFYVIDGFCNLYRTEKWNCGIKDKDKALSESSQSFDVFIHCDNIATFKNKIINFITNNTYDIKKYDIFNFLDASFMLLNSCILILSLLY